MSLHCLAPMFAGSSSYHPSASLGSYCKDSLSKPEIAGLMAGLRDYQVNFVYAYFGDEGAENRLIAHVRDWVHRLSKDEHWSEDDRASGGGSVGITLVCNIGAMAVFEVIKPNVCPTCHGSGLVGDIISNSSCPRCSGSGRVRLSNRRIAEILGVPDTSFRRKWCGRYEQVFGYVNGIEYQVKSIIYKAMYKDCFLIA